MAEIIDLFAQRFNKHAVLRGGMVLHMLGCERFTNDLDYVFIPYRSKKDIVDEVLSVLQSMPGVTLSHSLNSKCLRVIIKRTNTSVQVEAKTAMKVKTAPLSTASFTSLYDLPPRLIRVVDYSTALADKMAAWNERRLARDLYDIWFLLRMGITPDAETLKTRLEKPAYSKLVKQQNRFSGNTLPLFYEFILQEANKLTDDRYAAELQDYLKPTELPGISMRIRTELVKLTQS